VHGRNKSNTTYEQTEQSGPVVQNDIEQQQQPKKGLKLENQMTFPGNRPNSKADMRSLNPGNKPLAVGLVDSAECMQPTSVSPSIKPGDSTLVLSNKPSVCYSFKLYRC
jgi:hypothetical protein